MPATQTAPGAATQGLAGAQNADLFERARDALRDPLAPDSDPIGLGSDVGSLRTGHASTAPTRVPADVLAPRLVQQIATAAVGLADGPVELRLNPQELGHVRLRLESRDGAMAVLVTAERAETLDLLRRNIDLLAAGLRDVGYHELSFGFAGQGQAGTGESGREHAPPSPPESAKQTPPRDERSARRGDAGVAAIHVKTGVDIRL